MKIDNVIQEEGLNAEINIYGMTFELEGEKECEGSIRLNYTHSYTSEVIELPHSFKYYEGHALLNTIMRYVNSKLVQY